MAYELGKTYLLFSNGGTGQCLSVSSDTASNNRNVCIQDKNGKTAQNWTVKAFGSNYKIVTGLNQNFALNYYWSAGQGNAGNCDIYPQSGNDADSSVVLEPVCTDVYRIKLKNYNLYLTAKGGTANSDVRWEPLVNQSLGYDKLIPQEWRFVDPSAIGIRAPLIFAGYFSSETDPETRVTYSYTDSQLQGLGNATEFVICSGTYDRYFDSTGVPNSNGSLIQYVIDAVKMAKRLRTLYPNKQLWIGTPMVGTNVPYTNKAAYAEVGLRMAYFVDNIITQFANEGLDFNTCVKGFYMSNEGIMNPFVVGVSVADNYEVNMFQTLSNYVASKGKKMLWMPFWAGENIIKAACVAQRTNIFDYMLIQPGYYFEPSLVTCEGVRQAIAMQRVCYQNGMPILHENDITCTKTIIGCDMEVSPFAPDYATDAAAKQRYETYESVFSQSMGAFSKKNANFAFYFGCPKIGTTEYTSYNTCKNLVNDFFK